MLWAGYHTPTDRNKLFRALQRATAKAGTSAERLALWCGDVCFVGMNDGQLSRSSPIISSLIIGSHLSARTRAACDELGHELARIYRLAPLAEVRVAAIEYTSFEVPSNE